MAQTAETHERPLSNDEELQWSRDISRSKRKVTEASGAHRALLKRAKSAGINVKKLLETHEATKLDSDVVIADLRDYTHYLQLVGVPNVTPEAVFRHDAAVTQKTQMLEDVHDAEEAGYKAGRNGVPIDDNPYPPGSECHVAWREHWSEGQAAIALELGPDAKVASAAKAHPGRKGASASTTPEAPAKKAAAPRKGAAANGNSKPKRKGAAANGANGANGEAPAVH